MRKYKGYYIDGVVFKSEKEIDLFRKNEIIKKIKILSKMFESDRYTTGEKMRLVKDISDREKILHDEYGMEYAEIEMIPYTA